MKHNTATKSHDKPYQSAFEVRGLAYTPARYAMIRRIILRGTALKTEEIYIRGEVIEYLNEQAKAEAFAHGQVITCRNPECGCRMPIIPDGHSGIVTCENPSCDLYGYTFSASGYLDKDLTPYWKAK